MTKDDSVHRPDEPLKVLLVGARDGRGGAARALYRLYQALEDYERERLRVTLRVIESTTGDARVVSGKPRRTRFERLMHRLVVRLSARLFNRSRQADSGSLQSPSRYRTGLAREINSGDWDLVVLHWLGNRTLSIREVASIRFPIIWHLHDMWLFCGAEHIARDNRYLMGYPRESVSLLRWQDLNQATYHLKKRAWSKKRFHVITPSSWLAQESMRSALASDWPASVVPNTLDSDFWRPEYLHDGSSSTSREVNEAFIVAALEGGNNAWLKGEDLFFEMLRELRGILAEDSNLNPVTVKVFGSRISVPPDLGQLVENMGFLSDSELRSMYTRASVTVVPSRVENFNQVALESLACETPVVAFNTAGLPDIVVDGENGILAPAFDTRSMAEAVYSLILNPDEAVRMGQAGRAWVASHLHPREVAAQYANQLHEIYRRYR